MTENIYAILNKLWYNVYIIVGLSLNISIQIKINTVFKQKTLQLLVSLESKIFTFFVH